MVLLFVVGVMLTKRLDKTANPDKDGAGGGSDDGMGSDDELSALASNKIMYKGA